MLDATIGYISPDYLELYDAAFDREAILALRQERQAKLFEPQARQYHGAVKTIRDLQSDWSDFSGTVVKVGRADELSAEQQQRLHEALQVFCPWKKGPFDLFGITIDSEWRSDWKWARLLPHIHSLKDRKIADIGCHNGYFMFRMANEQPACVIGFEPVAKHFWNFQLIQNIVQQKTLTFELLGVEHMHFYPHFFDTIFCLGILYHHPDPIGLLSKMRQALAPHGEIIIDCQGIPSELPVALTPRKRYAQARGIWFLPSQSCLENWLARAGFTNIRCFFAEPLSVEEQRRTAWADVNSLQEFLNPDNPSLTIEGYPAPWRYYVIATRST
ncbi:tRNA 5-methoxyuridine(34)/uridine 5-oxyacetic acid(34) synthase CmoB [Leptolyngbya sp. FACHB-261]|uniref:tRNA 5-methoxyuridine(34)/uridine 5-oxyacetic acid(34) synthase CmoB n=1 Tax=Leptolyngbya sp. FACHB-261 TaxID=2692806 RepID=UPI001685B911|nr:tRNA 5-methoxyuridine(34)/uridine 5-oxyacetic acid(34) synthase CmoB [Leptolyngbya sp. FACHB-261]MBD2099735.1 tRNA 5-methoxyuridine(34)/uridine 5-oxyacetic acid(34) synthase CmoB [Leptolyngbya sp. FACHB-261]